MSRPERDHLAEQRRLAGLYRDLFEVDRRGQEVFADLYKRFFAHARIHTDGGVDAVLKTYRDASRREVVQHIVNQINAANGAADEEAPQPDGGEFDVQS